MSSLFQPFRFRLSARLALVPAALALILAGSVEPIAAQPPASEPEQIKDTIVVTASRIEQPAEDATTHLTVLPQEDLQLTAALTVDDALRRVPGFSLFRRASSVVANPTSQGVSLRGIGPSGVSRTLVLVDGIPLNDPFGGWIYWSRVSKESLERVEVVRGGGSNVWGSSALGGVIQLITRSDDGFRLGVVAEAGEESLRSADLSLANRGRRASFSLHGNLFDTDGYPVLREDQRGVIDVPAFSEHDLIGGRLGYQPSDRVELFARVAVFDETRGNGTPLTGNNTDTFSFGGGVDWLTGQSAWSFRLFGQDQEFDSFFSAQAADRSSERPALDQFLVDSSALGLSLQWTRADVSDRGHSLTAGTEFRATEGETNENYFFSVALGRFNNVRIAGGDETLGGVYLQDNWSLGPRLQVALGARVDRWQSDSGRRLQQSLGTGAVLRDDLFPDREETTLSPKLGFVYEASGNTRLRGSVYRAFRAPTINELYRPFRVGNDITEANEALVPETLVGGEIGGTVDGRDWRLDLTAFWNRLDDPIANVTLALGPGVIAPCGFVPGGGSCRQRQNLDRTRVLGFEAEWSLRLSPSWRLQASYLYDDAEVQAAPSRVLEGKRLAQVPEHQLMSRIDYLPSRRGACGRFSGSLQGRWVSEQFEDDLNVRELDSFVAVDAMLAYRASERLSLFAAAENLSDQTIEVGQSAAGLVTIGPPRLVRLGLRLSLSR